MPNASRFGDLRRKTLSWCRRTRISASNAARDRNRNSPIKAHQINLQRSLIGSEYQPIRGRGQPFWVCGRDSGQITSSSSQLICQRRPARTSRAPGAHVPDGRTIRQSTKISRTCEAPPPYIPDNGLVERLIGSARHECTDHVIVFNEDHLRRILSNYASY